jgi:bile acid:Na+ symporter, BASS family
MDFDFEYLAKLLLGPSLIVFMAGNLFDTGLKLRLDETAGALANRRFAASSLVWSFAIGPAFAVALTRILPLESPFAIALILIGLAPCAPFLPAMAQRAGCRIADIAAFLLLASVGTIIFMPVLAPLLVPAFPVDAWSIAKPLLLYVALPMAAGILVRAKLGQVADRLQAPVRIATVAATALLLVFLVILYYRDFMAMPGTWAIGALVIFCTVLPLAAYFSGSGMDRSQRSVLALGLCTRNVGAAIAPLYAVPGTDPRAMAMCAMAVPVTLVLSAIAARILANSGRETAQS